MRPPTESQNMAESRLGERRVATGSRSHRLQAAGTQWRGRELEIDAQVRRKGCGWGQSQQQPWQSDGFPNSQVPDAGPSPLQT